MSRFDGRISRRQLLGGLAASAAGIALPKAARAQSQDRRFLIVIGGTGGASIIDSFMPIRSSESANAATINTFPDQEVFDIAGSQLRAVELSASTLGAPGFASLPMTWDPTALRSITERRKDDLLVTSMTSTSVNHTVGQKRAITGNAAWNGRTLQELVAMQYGQELLLPNVNMGFGGYLEDGTDRALPPHSFKEPLTAHPVLWTFSTDGSRGIKDLPPRSLIDAARRVRDTQLVPASECFKRVQNHESVTRWLDQRGPLRERIESADLITQLQMAPDQPPVIPLNEFGLLESPDGARIRAAFPNWLDDPLEAQAALAFLLIKNQLSVTVTLSPTFNPVLLGSGAFVNLPLSFDYSHTNHRFGQAVMWSRIMSVTDRLIGLLQDEIFDPNTGERFWDRSMIYIATDFGRSKGRPLDPMAPEGSLVFGSGHDLNNGVAILSPMVQGNTVLGGVDPHTGMTFGFDRVTGAPTPSAQISEEDVFAGMLGALGLELPSSMAPVPAMIRST